METYLAIDPGETSGWATFNHEGTGMQMGQCIGRKELYELLEGSIATTIICEDYIIDPNVKHGGNRGETLRVIGAIEHHAWRKNIHMVLQPRTVKGIGYRWAGIEKPKNHSVSHTPDAYVHGVVYLQRQGIRKPQQGRA